MTQCEQGRVYAVPHDCCLAPTQGASFGIRPPAGLAEAEKSCFFGSNARMQPHVTLGPILSSSSQEVT